MHKTFIRAFIACSAVSFLMLAQAGDTKNIVVNGDFEQPASGNDVPGWTVVGDPSQVAVAEKDGKHFVRLTIPKQTFCLIKQTFTVDDKWSEVMVSAKIRAQGLVKGPEGHNTITLLYTFEDAADGHLGGWTQSMVQADQDWTEVKETVKVVPGAVKFTVSCAVMNASGVAEFDDVVVTPVK